MNGKTRLWVLGTAIVSASLILFGIVGGLLPQLSLASSTDDLVESAQIRNDAQQAQIEQLSTAEKGTSRLVRDVEELQLSLPPTAETAELLRDLEQFAAASGVQLTSVSAATPVPPTVDQATADQLAADAAAAQAATDEAAAAADVTSGDEDVAVDAAAVPATGLMSIPLTVVANGSPDALASFVRAVQTGSRLIVLNQLDIVEDSDSGSTATIAGMIFFAA